MILTKTVKLSQLDISPTVLVRWLLLGQMNSLKTVSARLLMLRRIRMRRRRWKRPSLRKVHLSQKNSLLRMFRRTKMKWWTLLLSRMVRVAPAVKKREDEGF